MNRNHTNLREMITSNRKGEPMKDIKEDSIFTCSILFKNIFHKDMEKYLLNQESKINKHSLYYYF